jgi:hypothetical protein
MNYYSLFEIIFSARVFVKIYRYSFFKKRQNSLFPAASLSGGQGRKENCHIKTANIVETTKKNQWKE